MATISSGSVTVTIQPGEQYRVIATGEAYVDIGGGSTQSYRLINGSSEKLLGGFIVATPVTVRVISGSVEYINVSGTGDSVALSLAQSSRTDISGVVASTASGVQIGPDGVAFNSKRLRKAIVATRNRPPADVVTGTNADGIRYVMTYSTHIAVDTIKAGSVIDFTWSNWALKNAVETNSGSVLNVLSATVENPYSTFTPILFGNGSLSSPDTASGANVTGYMVVTSDIKAGTKMGVGSYCKFASGSTTFSVPFHTECLNNPMVADYCTFGNTTTDRTYTSGPVASSFDNYGFRPSLITAMTARDVFVLAGDSRTFGSADTTTTTAGSFNIGFDYTIKTVGSTDFTLIGAASNTVGVTFTATGVGTGTGTAIPSLAFGYGLVGEVDRYIGKRWGTLNLGCPSEQLTNALNGYTKRAALIALSGANVCINNYGINDFLNGRTEAQLRADQATFRNTIASGLRYYVTTISPRTTGAWTLANLSDQTVFSGEAARVAYNQNNRYGKPLSSSAIADGYIEIADYTESSRNSGKWAANGTAAYATADGLHGSPAILRVVEYGNGFDILDGFYS